MKFIIIFLTELLVYMVGFLVGKIAVKDESLIQLILPIKTY